MKNLIHTAITCLLLSLTGCKTDFAEIPTYTNTKQLQAVIEVPAGTSHTIRYNQPTKEFVTDKEAGLDRVVEFLPYPGNYGFIPSTEIEQDGRGLGILVIAEAMPTGTVTEVTPIATLLLENLKGEIEAIIIAVPARPSERLISATDYKTFTQEYPAVKNIIQQWFLHHDQNAQTKLVAWKDELFSEKEIQRWMKL